MKKKLLKTISIITLSLISLISFPTFANATWKRNSTGLWFEDGNSYAIGWKKINETWYYFDADGYMKTGWVNDGGSWYFLDNNGAMKTGRIKYNSVTYYLDENGAMVTDTMINEGIYNYYFNQFGAMVTGFYTLPDGNTFYFYENGIMATNTLVDGYLINEVGIVSDKKANINYSANDAIELIKKEDKNFIDDFKSQQNITDAKLFIFSVCKSSYYLNSYNINDEIVYCIELFNPTAYKSQLRHSYLYYVGAKSGNVYSAYNLGTGKIYQIENNKITARYTSTFNKKAPDWR